MITSGTRGPVPRGMNSPSTAGGRGVTGTGGEIGGVCNGGSVGGAVVVGATDMIGTPPGPVTSPRRSISA